MIDTIASYDNGGYRVRILADGTKIRDRISDAPPVLPETMDLKITDWCDAGCAWCHEGSTKRGRHGDGDAILSMMSQLPAGIEIAIGGGDPMSHPQFERMVRSMRDMGLIANVTINGRHLERHRSRLEALIAEKAIVGVGVSVFDRIPDWGHEHLVVHMIAGVDDPAMLEGIERRKVLILGYKDFGRGTKHRSKHTEKVDARIQQWRRELLWLAHAHHLAFDTLAISQLEPRRLFKDQASYDRRYMGDEGQFSMYLDGVEQTFGLASYSPERAAWTDMADMFARVRAKGLDGTSLTQEGLLAHG